MRHTAPSAKDTRQEKQKQMEETSKQDEPTLSGGKVSSQPAAIGHEASPPPTSLTPPRSLLFTSSSLDVTSLLSHQLEFTDQRNYLVTWSAAIQPNAPGPPRPSRLSSP